MYQQTPEYVDKTKFLASKSSKGMEMRKIIPELVSACINTYNIMHGGAVKEVEVNITFGEYANPSFESQVETIGKAKTQGIMSIEQCVEELYGDTLDEHCKKEEIARLKAEQGIQEMQEPGVNMSAGDFQVKVTNRMYRMNRKEYKGLLKVASD